MSLDSENFEQLRRLVALKRHEQPPPGYFHHFSREVIVRIKAGETGDQITVSWWSWNGSWMQRVWAAVETRPALAGAFGVAVCGFFAAGALLSENGNTAVPGVDPSAPAPMVLGSIVPPQHLGGWNSTHVLSLNPSGMDQTAQPANSLFDFQHQQAQAFNVNFVPGGN